MRLACPVAAINLQLTDSAGPEVRLKSGTLIRNTDTVWAALEVLREDSTFFPDPLAFKPHRWLDATPSQVLQMENLILPFGFGPRICPGMSLALIEGPVVVAHILHHFDFRLDCPPTEVVRVASQTVGPSKMPIVFTPR
jgi:cytochrome P450